MYNLHNNNYIYIYINIIIFIFLNEILLCHFLTFCEIL